VTRAIYQSIHPIGDTDPQALPVADVARAVADYERRFGFTVRERGEAPVRYALVGRDGIEVRLAENGGDPEQASCYVEVSDVDRARQELEQNGVPVSPIRIDRYGGKAYRVFFAKDDDGICYCLGQRQPG
jgi:hypothetical protein